MKILLPLYSLAFGNVIVFALTGHWGWLGAWALTIATIGIITAADDDRWP